jgi:hypothetical protein
MEQVPRGSLQLQQSTHWVSAYYRPLPNLYVFTIYNHLPISCDEANVPNCKVTILDNLSKPITWTLHRKVVNVYRGKDKDKDKDKDEAIPLQAWISL